MAKGIIVPSAFKQYRISGHESFPCRYAWLPKIVHQLRENPALIGDDDKAMIELGLGKNMVRSAWFWAQATGIIESRRNEISITEFGDILLGTGDLDPFIEDIRTLWLLHWHLSTNIENPLLAWDYLLNRWQEPELVPSLAMKALYREASKSKEGLSTVTLQQHFDVFLHSYIPTRGKKGKVQEDNLDCPLVELSLLQKAGERESSINDGGRESVYAFRYDDKPDITPELFSYCIADYWNKRFPNEHTLAFRDVAHGHGSPGQVFKLPEDAIRARLDSISDTSIGCFTYTESAQLQQLQKTGKEIVLKEFLKNVYVRETSHA